MCTSNPVIKQFYPSALGLCFFSPIKKTIQNKKCFGCFFVSFIGGLNESHRRQGTQSHFSQQSSSNPPASASWRNCYWALIICTPQRCRPSEHHWEERKGDYWIFLEHLCPPLQFAPVYFGRQQNSFCFVFLLGQWWLKAISLDKSWRKNPCGFHLDIRGLICFAVTFYF